MPLLEIVQTHQVSATIRLDQNTAEQIDQYAAFLHASADEVVDKALAYVFAKDRDFQEYLRTPQAARAAQSLRIRRPPQNGDGTEPQPRRTKSARRVGAARPEIRAHAAGMERPNARSVLHTGFISTLQEVPGSIYPVSGGFGCRQKSVGQSPGRQFFDAVDLVLGNAGRSGKSGLP
jgi:hypothetical protein